MKVGMLLRRFPKLSETFILNQITGLIDAGVEVDIFARRPGSDAVVHRDVDAYGLMDRTRYLAPARSRLRRIASALAHPGLTVRCIGRRRRLSPGLVLAHAAATVRRRGPYDLVHAQFGQLGLTALTLRELGVLPGRMVVAFRGADLTVHPDVEAYRALFQSADLVLPVCKAFRDRLIELGCDPRKVRVHHSGIDLARFRFTERSKPSQGGTRLLTIARLVEKKGVEYGIRAVAMLKEAGRDVTLTVVGDGPLRPELGRLTDALGVEDRIRFTGPLAHEAVLKAVSDAHILVAPSHTGSDGDQEGIPNALKEAMATGLPVVSTRHSGIPELVEDGVSGLLVPERDAEALTDRLGYLLDHPERWADMGRAGRARIEAEYDIHELNRRLIELYREVLSGTPASRSDLSQTGIAPCDR